MKKDQARISEVPTVPRREGDHVLLALRVAIKKPSPTHRRHHSSARTASASALLPPTVSDHHFSLCRAAHFLLRQNHPRLPASFSLSFSAAPLAFFLNRFPLLELSSLCRADPHSVPPAVAALAAPSPRAPTGR